MGAFDIVIRQGVEPSHLLGLQTHLVEAVATTQTRPLLLIYTMRGRVLSLGRYHLYDGPIERARSVSLPTLHWWTRHRCWRGMVGPRAHPPLARCAPARSRPQAETRPGDESICARPPCRAARSRSRMLLSRPRRRDFRAARTRDVHLRDRRLRRDAVRGYPRGESRDGGSCARPRGLRSCGSTSVRDVWPRCGDQAGARARSRYHFQRESPRRSRAATPISSAAASGAN